MKHYSAYRPGPLDRCQECGEAATVVYVSDYYESEGYINELPLCNTHAALLGGDFPLIPEDEYDEEM